MKTTTTVRLLKNTIGNPATRRILRGMGKYCEKDGKNRIEVAVELYTGQRKDACLSCKLTEKMIAKVLKKGADAFSVTEDELKKKFSDPYWAKGLSSTIMGVAQFGVKKPFTSGAPFQIVWDVTYACNLKCKHCYATAGKTWKDELSTEEAKRAIDIFDRAGVTIIAFSGGEPLVRPDILELTKYAADKGIYVAIATNGTLITKEKAREMNEAGVQFVQISLDGASAETHDKFRGIQGAFDKTVDGVKNSVEKGFFVEISTTATKYNYKEIPDIIRLSEELGANWFMAFNFIPTGRGKDIVKVDLTPDEREEMLKMLWNELKARKNINVLSTAPQFARVALQQEEGEDEKVVPTHFYNPKLAGQLVDLAEFIGGCGAGRFYMAMHANGDLQPCVFFPLKLGNIREDDFEELWIHNKVLQDLRDKDLLKGCDTCDYRYYCGGCRARAYAYTGDYLSPDPGCINNRRLYEKVLEE
ncbi:MAG: radical SAM protein [Candidatus Thermoplasmatota archaeon]|nr:radical SAM protein [Candidatus Thermoplasmatota archaeon]